MNTTPANAADSPDIQHIRWRIDTERSSVEFHVRNFYGLQTVKGRFERHAGWLDLAAEPRVRFLSELATLDGERLRVRGELHAAGKSTSLDLEGVIRPDGDELVVDVTTFADHRQLGMTWNRLGMLRGPSKLIIRGRLVRDDH